MAFAVSCWFDSATEAKIRDIWREISDCDYDSTMTEGPYRPHVTLGVCGTLAVSDFSAELRKFANKLEEVPLEFSSIGVFPNNPPVVFLAITQTNLLRDLHANVHALMSNHGSDPVPYYLPNSWVPHCTLAPWADRKKLAGLVDYLAGLQLPISGRVDRLGIIDTPAEVELEEVLLSKKDKMV